jgi:transketolase
VSGSSTCGNSHSKTDPTEFRQRGTVKVGHPKTDVESDAENTSGPLEQGHVMGTGAPLSGKFFEHWFGAWTGHKIYA